MEDGLRGVARALSDRPDVMLVDIGLPGLDGYEVARRVRSALGQGVEARRGDRLRPAGGSPPRDRGRLRPAPHEAGRLRHAVPALQPGAWSSRYGARRGLVSRAYPDPPQHEALEVPPLPELQRHGVIGGCRVSATSCRSTRALYAASFTASVNCSAETRAEQLAVTRSPPGASTASAARLSEA